MSQKLIMTPSLQQAIKLLQLSKLELQEVLNEELLENPLLEESAEEDQQKAEDDKKAEQESQADDRQEKDEKDEKDAFDEIDYDAYFQDYIDYGYNPRMREEYDEFPIENTLSRPQNLWDHLTWQLTVSDAPPHIKEIATFLIGNIDEDGYLRVSDEEMQEADENWDQKDVDEAVIVVRSFDPPGVGARDLRECLQLQVDRLDIEEPLVNEIIENHWPMFMNRQFVQLHKALGYRSEGPRASRRDHPAPRSEAGPEVFERAGGICRARRSCSQDRR